MPTRRDSAFLFAGLVLIWGSTWHAIVHQLPHATPEFGVALRFALAGLCALGVAAGLGQSLYFPLRTHALLAWQGTFMYSASYVCVYHAERHVPSGLVAVGYSASPLVMGLAGAAWRGQKLTQRFVIGGVLGVAGVALIFAPEFGRIGTDRSTALGAAFTVGAVLLSSVGAFSSARNGERGLAFWPALGYGMVYSAIVSAALSLFAGSWPSLPLPLSWWLSLAWLVVFGSVLAFACFLALQQRIGATRAATVGVVTPVIALAVSTAVEGFRPGLLTVSGVALALAGSWLCLGLPIRSGGARAAG